MALSASLQPEKTRRLPRANPRHGALKGGTWTHIDHVDQENETLDVNKCVSKNMHYRAPQLAYTDARKFLGLFWLTGDNDYKRSGVISGAPFCFGSDVETVTALDPETVLT